MEFVPVLLCLFSDLNVFVMSHSTVEVNMKGPWLRQHIPRKFVSVIFFTQMFLTSK